MPDAPDTLVRVEARVRPASTSKSHAEELWLPEEPGDLAEWEEVARHELAEKARYLTVEQPYRGTIVLLFSGSVTVYQRRQCAGGKE